MSEDFGPIDLRPAAERLAQLVAGVRDEQLTRSTPCDEFSVGRLLGHIDDLSKAFVWAAAKQIPPEADGPAPEPTPVTGDWRTRIPAQLSELGEAWADPGAWDGMTKAGGIDMAGQIGGMVATDEVVVHGWDLAKATGQPFDADAAAIAAAASFAAMFDDDSREGLFGPTVSVPDDASPLDKLIGAVGRDPAWNPGQS